MGVWSAADGNVHVDRRQIRTAQFASIFQALSVAQSMTVVRRLKQRLAQIKSQEQAKDQEPLTLAFDNNLETGFQLATFQGPLCAEPVEGMAYFVESLTLDREGIEQEQGMCAQLRTIRCILRA